MSTNVLKGTIFASIAGLLGAALWMLIAWKVGIQSGILAWGIGFVVGIAIHYGAQEERGHTTGAIAAIIAVVAILLGKYGAVVGYTNNAYDKIKDQIRQDITAREVIVAFADEIVVPLEDAGKKLAWRNGKTSSDDAEDPSDYPVDIEAQATKKWNALSPEEQDSALDERREIVIAVFESQRSKVTSKVFISSFGLFDILWFVLAVGSAWKIGVGDMNT